MLLTGFVNNKQSQFRNDCTVRALTAVTGLDYRTVFETLKLYGRRDNHGFNIHGWLKQHKGEVLGHCFVPERISPRGKYLCYNRGHAWAIINGNLHDQTNRSLRAKYCYRVIKNVEEDRTEEKMRIASKQARLFNED